MSLYYMQKFLYQLNRDAKIRHRFENDPQEVLSEYELTDEELSAISKPDIGLLYVLGVNGQLLMHFAALHQFEWDDYLQAMRDGVIEHGPVREGLYTMAADRH